MAAADGGAGSVGSLVTRSGRGSASSSPQAALAATARHVPGITRARAQQLARRELARSMYHPSLLERWQHDLGNWFNSLFTFTVAGGSSAAGFILLALVIAAILAVLFWIGPVSGRAGRRQGQPVLAGRPRSAADYRAAADLLAAAGSYAEALAERMRAIAAELEARGTLPPRPSRTAAELAAEAGRLIPAEAPALQAAARLFDRVRYGGRVATQADDRQVADLDRRISATRPASPQLVPAGAESGGSAP